MKILRWTPDVAGIAVCVCVWLVVLVGWVCVCLIFFCQLFHPAKLAQKISFWHKVVIKVTPPT